MVDSKEITAKEAQRALQRVDIEETYHPDKTCEKNGSFRLKKRMPDGDGGKCVCGVALVLLGIAALLLVILLPLSFVGLEYYQMGFRRRKTTGSVDTSYVYEAGRHHIGPDFTFKPFPADAHFEKFERIRVFASDRLEVEISAQLQYFLRKDQLQNLHRQFDINYKPVLRKNAQDALKAAATLFSTRELIRDRLQVESALFQAVRERLGGSCCWKDCNKDGTCAPQCKPYSKCKEADWGLFADVRYFQLLDLAIPSELNERFLRALILQEEADTEQFRQDAILVREDTIAEVQQIQNEANEIRENATAYSTLIRAEANAQSRLIVEEARSTGLEHLYSELGITDAGHKATFDYLRTLKQMPNAHLTVNYETILQGALNTNSRSRRSLLPG